SVVTPFYSTDDNQSQPDTGVISTGYRPVPRRLCRSTLWTSPPMFRKLSYSAPGRREILRASLVTGVALLIHGCGSGAVTTGEKEAEISALALALNVEYLLAEVYGWAL